MPTVDFLPFATDPSANVQAQAAFSAAPTTGQGFAAGIAESDKLNKVWRQSAFIGAVVANMMSAQLAIDVLDDGDLAGAVTDLTAAIAAIAGNSGGRFYAYAGNPNTFVAGRTGTAGTTPPDLCYDTTNKVVYVCTTTGNAAAAVWQNISSIATGAVGTPGLPLSGYPTTGLYGFAANKIGVAAAGAVSAVFASGQVGVAGDIQTGYALFARGTGAIGATDGTRIVQVAANATGGIIQSTTAHPLLLGANGVEGARLDTTLRFLVGVTTPATGYANAGDMSLGASNNIAANNTAKAWVNFDASIATPAIRRAFNCSSITDRGAGAYTVNFTNNLALNYCPTFGTYLNNGSSSASRNWVYVDGTNVYGTAMSASAIQVASAGDGGGVTEPQGFFVTIH